MRVLLVLDSYPPDLNGGAYFTHRLAKVLLTLGIEVQVACPSLSLVSHDDDYEGVPLYRFSSFPSFIYKNFRIINPIHLNKKSCALLTVFKPDIVHLQGKFILGNAIFKKAKKMGIPCFATNHLMPQNFEHYFKIPKFLNAVYTRFVWTWVFQMYEQLPIIVSPTKSGAIELNKNGFTGRVEVVSCGVDCNLFHQQKNVLELKKIFGLPNNFIILYTGRLDKEKNIDVVLKACAILSKKISFHLVITGTGKEENKLKKLAKELGIDSKVTFTGKINDAEFPDIYKVADVFVNACLVELQCISGLEALAAGLPLVLANSLALPELIDSDLPNGFTFIPNNHIQLAEILYRVQTDDVLRKQLGENSLKLSQVHDLKHTANRYIDIYNRLTK